MRFYWLWLLAFSTPSLAQSSTVQNSNTNEDLRGLSAVSASIAWSSGTHGTYLRTTDGGATWTPNHVPGAEGLDFRDVQAFSADEAYLLAAGPGEQSRIYKTADGGATWTLQFTNHDPRGFYDCMAFWDQAHGIALGDPIDGQFELITTDDGGAHWNALPAVYRPHSLAEEGAFAASGTCIVAQGERDAWFVTGGSAARVFHSVDRGQTWAAADVPIAHDGASAGVFSIALSGMAYGITGGGDYKHPDQPGPCLAYTEDGGVTWRNAEIRPQAYFSAVALDPTNPRHVLAVGSTHAAYTDDVNDKQWRAYWDMNLNAAAFAEAGKAFAVGPRGAIVRFTLP